MYLSCQDADRAADTAQYEFARRDAYAAARASAGTCGYCGSMDGMKDYDREAVEFALECEGLFQDAGPLTYFQWRPNPHHLSRPCPECNPRGVVPAGYGPMTRAQAQAWIETPCDCTACMVERGEIKV